MIYKLLLIFFFLLFVLNLNFLLFFLLLFRFFLSLFNLSNLSLSHSLNVVFVLLLKLFYIYLLKNLIPYLYLRSRIVLAFLSGSSLFAISVPLTCSSVKNSVNYLCSSFTSASSIAGSKNTHYS
jgi:hypothetical protein